MAATARLPVSSPSASLLGLPQLTPRMVVTAAGLTALLIGALMALGAQLAVALLAAAFYAPIALMNLPLGLALWFPSVFISYLPGLGNATHAAAVFLGIAWLGTFAARGRSVGVPGGGQHLALAVGLLVWLLVSLAWAEVPGDSLWGMYMWTPPVLLFAMVVTRVRTEQHIRWLVIAFIAGATISVLIGLAMNGLSSSASAIDTATRQEGRLQGGAGDPNVLAAGIVPAIVLAIALAVGVRTTAARIALGLTAFVLAAGLAATESRGGLIAMVITLAAAIVVAKGRRAAIVAVTALLIGTAGLWFVNSPSGLERMTTFDGGGNGRSDLWAVGADMARDHPLFGVGLSNFQDRARDYVTRPRELQFVELIAENPHVAHNTYLQLVAETGIVGLLLFLAVVGACMQTALRAAARFDARGNDAQATLARAVFVGILAVMAASVFLTNGHDSRLWLLMGLAVALYGLSKGEQET